MFKFIITSVLSWVFFVSPAVYGQASEEVLQRIAFGSCARESEPQPIWEAIVKGKPDLFIFLGDNIYADTEDMDVMRAKYEMLAAQPGYQKLKETCPVLATWDDHDYGENDAGAEYPKRAESQQVFLDFFGEPEDSPRRTREGIYDAKLFGPVGRRVQVILLDTRYFRSPLMRGAQKAEPGEGYRGPYIPNEEASATVLGEAQWNWLEEQLHVPAELRIIASSIQVIPREHGWEKWANFPRERQRLFDLIRATGANGVVLLSGDRHLAEISRMERDLPYAIYEVTSSSLNRPSGNFTPLRVRWVNEVNTHRIGLIYFETNYGWIDLDWEAADPVVRLQVRDEQGNVMLQQRVAVSELRP
jgi:alkaline phosphatase D